MGKRRKINQGDILGSLEVLENEGFHNFYGKNITFYKCKCLKCGTILDVPAKYLGSVKKDCGCGKKEPRAEIPVGEKFGHLTVIGLGHYQKGRGYWYKCQCDCEKQTIIEARRDTLLCGEVTSCGCVHDSLLRENAKTAYKRNFVKNTNVPQIAYDNLRRNNTSGVKGVSWHKRLSKWQARIQFQKTSYHLGYYDSLDDAAEIRRIAEKELHKDFWKWYSENYPEQWEKIKANQKH